MTKTNKINILIIKIIIILRRIFVQGLHFSFGCYQFVSSAVHFNVRALLVTIKYESQKSINQIINIISTLFSLKVPS